MTSKVGQKLFDCLGAGLTPGVPGRPRILSKNQLAKEGPDSVWPQWLYQPWPQRWIGPSSMTGPSVRSELCATTWTVPQAE